MVTNSQAIAKSSPKRRKLTAWIIVGACIALLAGVAALYVVRMNASRVENLGVQMEYIGQDQLRCYFWGLMCDSDAYKVYYFATDMTEEQVKEYFKGGEYVGRDLGSQGANFTSDGLLFQNRDGKKFIVQYYHDIQPSKINNGLKQTDKLYGLSMTDGDYATARSAL